MASKLLLPQIPASHVVPRAPILIRTMVMRTHCASSAPLTRYSAFRDIFSGRPPRSIYATRVQEQSSSADIVGEELSRENTSLAEIKTDVYRIVEGINRGIFGVPSATKSEIETLVEQLEAQNPNPDPTLHLDKLGGTWRLLYSTITILGSKRTKLGLRDFINLGDLLQTIDVAEGKAINVIEFNARGLNLLSGQLKIEASFKIASRSRVAITYENSTITPDQLMNVFRKNYDILLAVFNPEGWLEITYVDETLRIGRDDKGNIFILERELP